MTLLNVLRATMVGGVCCSAIVSPFAADAGRHRNRPLRAYAPVSHRVGAGIVISPPPAAPAAVAGPTVQRRGDGPADSSRRLLVGLVVPAEQVTVRAAVDGVVRSAQHMGDPVNSGEVIALLDDGELVLESERLKAKAAAIACRAEAAAAEVRLHEQRGEQLRAGQERRAATPSEVAQNRCLREAAAARVKGLEEERKEAELERRALEQRRQNYRCVAPITGEVAEVSRRKWEYVRAGETILRIRSWRRQVRLNLPASLADRPPVCFTLAGTDQRCALRPTTAEMAYNANGGRSVTLELPEGLVLAVGKEVEVEVVTP
jgi:multidrug efflux pump subunit AcrA (membrane-fusion protein)